MDEATKRKQEMMAAMDNRKKQKSLTVEIYKGLKKQKVIDARIMEKYGFNTVNFTKWKHDNGLIVKSTNRKPQKDAQSTIEDKRDECMEKVQNTVEVDYKAKYEALMTACETLKDDSLQAEEKFKGIIERKDNDIGKLIEENEKLKMHLGTLNMVLTKQSRQNAELEESLAASTQTFTATDAQEEIWKLSQEVERLKKYEADYRNLEVDYRNLHSENDRLKRMLERLKNTERMNLWMMEQYVGLYEQVDEVMV